MKETIRFIKNAEWLTLSIAVMLGVLFIVSVAQAATTISTNIQTDGTLSVTGASTLGNASTTLFSSYGPAYFGATATSSFSTTGALTLAGNLTVPAGYSLDTAAAGVLNLGTTTATTINIGGTQATTKVLGLFQVPAAYGIDTSAAGVLNIGTTTATTINIGGTQATIKVGGNLTIPANYSLDTATAGTLNIGTTTANAITIGKAGVTTNNPGLTTMTNASTTQLTVGGSTGTALNAVQMGFCNLTSATITATSTGYTTCAGAGTVDNTYRIIVQATSSLPAGLIIDAASTTATAGTVSLRINNANAGANTATGAISINFWAFK